MTEANKTLIQIRTEKRRLVMLRLLHMEPDFSISVSDMQSVLATVGHQVAMDVIRADATFLTAHKLTDHTEFDTLVLTETGADVGNGLTLIQGIARPEPATIRALQALSKGFTG